MAAVAVGSERGDRDSAHPPSSQSHSTPSPINSTDNLANWIYTYYHQYFDKDNDDYYDYNSGYYDNTDLDYGYYPTMDTNNTSAVYTYPDYDHTNDFLLPHSLGNWEPPESDQLPDDLPYEVKVTFTVTYVLIMSLAIAGNLLVITVIARTPKMRTVTNTFLVSLAVSDLCIATLNMPFQLRFYMQNEWTLGEILCKFTKYMQGVVIVASILTLSGIAIDR